MRKLLIGWVSAVALMAGCATPNGPTTAGALATREAAEAEVTDTVLVRYSRGRSPCVDVGDGRRAWFRVDDFEVLKVLDGRLDAGRILVQPNTWDAPGYPREPADGEVYTLRLTPSPSTRQQLRDNRKAGHSSVWVDGSEIEQQAAGG